MTSKITRDVVESYLRCALKASLKLQGASGVKSEYETLITVAAENMRLDALDRLRPAHPRDQVERRITLDTAGLIGKGTNGSIRPVSAAMICPSWPWPRAWRTPGSGRSNHALPNLVSA